MAMKREREPHKKWNLAARMSPFNSPQWWFKEIYLGLANNGILLQYIYIYIYIFTSSWGSREAGLQAVETMATYNDHLGQRCFGRLMLVMPRFQFAE